MSTAVRLSDAEVATDDECTILEPDIIDATVWGSKVQCRHGDDL